MVLSALPREAKNLNLSTKEKIALAVGTLVGLKEIEHLIEEKFDSEAALLSEIPRYLLKLGGKRIRPVLCLLVAQSLHQKALSQSVIDVAAGIELIHMATLLHDDIIDKSPLRRHEASPYVKYGIGDTLLAGDFLLVRAFSLCAHLDKYIIDATERACIELTEGEILEVPMHRMPHTLDTSLTISRKKTGALFRLAAESAAYLATRGDMRTVKDFTEFGEHLGIAFQVLDDILDVTSSEEQLGKKAGIDIQEKKPSPVNILWLQTGSALAKELLTRENPANDEELALALTEITQSNVIDAARKIARLHADAARGALTRVHLRSGGLENKAYEALLALIDYVLERME